MIKPSLLNLINNKTLICSLAKHLKIEINYVTDHQNCKPEEDIITLLIKNLPPKFSIPELKETLKNNFGINADIYSETAIKEAKKRFPNYSFYKNTGNNILENAIPLNKLDTQDTSSQFSL